jgi:hypothetical protein
VSSLESELNTLKSFLQRANLPILNQSTNTKTKSITKIAVILVRRTI